MWRMETTRAENLRLHVGCLVTVVRRVLVLCRWLEAGIVFNIPRCLSAYRQERVRPTNNGVCLLCIASIVEIPVFACTQTRGTQRHPLNTGADARTYVLLLLPHFLSTAAPCVRPDPPPNPSHPKFTEKSFSDATEAAWARNRLCLVYIPPERGAGGKATKVGDAICKALADPEVKNGRHRLVAQIGCPRHQMLC